MTRLFGLIIVLGCITFGLPACDSGGATNPTDRSVSPPPAPPPEQGVGDVTVQVVTESGAPIPQVWVGMGGNFGYRDATTDADGRVRFAEVPAGDVGVDVGARGFHWARRSVVVEADQTTALTLAIVRAVEATPVVLAAHALPSADGRSLTVDVDLAVLGEDGLAVPNLTADDFRVSGSDCGFAMCVMDVTGAPLPNGSYTARVDPGVFRWHEAASDPAATSALALLLEQSAVQADFDPQRRRFEAIHAFLDSMSAPDSVAVASYHGTPQAPVLATYGSFTSDGALLHDDVDAIADDAGLNPMYAALADMVSWAATQPIAAGQHRVVLVSGRSSWADDECGQSSDCRHALRVAVSDSSRALDMPIVSIGGHDPAADIAARSGGLSVAIEDPEQYAVILGNLKSIVVRQLGFNRVRFVLTGGAQVFESGGTVWAHAQVRVGSDSWLDIPVVVLIP